ncbi:hypothetical protein [Lichenifustis flavocetrariae]|uniref:Uncharacterized protein n=1 Tax=Lichenifustis flavocetrariae TaxID=2949735 RepID=A0AA41YUM0_9HYPH|nr:hypothetical protein [Lichenifustis flavocetrariae]MCW6508864.1 hypothetical protein [Lichenifustis flavocetrariae]
MPITTASAKGPQITADDADTLMSAHDRMLARHKLIEDMIRNNELQLKNESARGGAEIERASALRTAATDLVAQAEVEKLDLRLNALASEHLRLVSEREWLNASLLEFEQDPLANRHDEAGHA